jgi:hypothetical protein
VEYLHGIGAGLGADALQVHLQSGLIIPWEFFYRSSSKSSRYAVNLIKTTHYGLSIDQQKSKICEFDDNFYFISEYKKPNSQKFGLLFHIFY